jgi:hypothetical protein
MTTVRTRLPNSYYDRLTAIAHKNGVSMSEAARLMIILQLRKI